MWLSSAKYARLLAVVRGEDAGLQPVPDITNQSFVD
jgi:hypothetical protein